MTKNTLKVGTFNIAAGLKPKPEAIAKVINQQELDIIGLQEVDYYTERTPYDLLKEIAGEQFLFDFFSSNLDFENGQYGNGLLSKGPFLSQAATFYQAHPELGQIEQRGYQHVVIEKQEKTISFYNTHLSYERPELRHSQFEELLRVLAKDTQDYQVIVGDFNTDQTIRELDLMNSYYQNVNGQGEWRATFHHVDPEMKTCCIDNIFVSRNIRVVDWQVNMAEVSDHYLLWAVLELV